MPTELSPNLVAPAVPDNYPIGRNDLISVFVSQIPALTRQVRVSANGEVRLPYMSKGVVAAGDTPLQLQHALAAELQGEGLARDPVVEVTVREVASKPIIIGGAVKNPGTIQAARPLSLLEVLASAGGLVDASGDRVLVSTSSSAGPQVAEFNLAHLMQNPNTADNPLLSGGETVTVLPAERIYVVGAFQKPGAFPLSVGQNMTVIRAVALAGGFASSPNKRQGQILRTSAGVRQILPIDLDRIMKHQSPDLPLESDDILYVATNGRQKAMATALQDTVQVVTLGIAYTFPKW